VSYAVSQLGREAESGHHEIRGVLRAAGHGAIASRDARAPRNYVRLLACVECRLRTLVEHHGDERFCLEPRGILLVEGVTVFAARVIVDGTSDSEWHSTPAQLVRRQ